MRRRLIGVVSLSCLLAAGAMMATEEWDTLQRSMLFSTCVRLGLTLGAIWLAFPQVEAITRRVSPIWFGLAAVVLIVLIARPKALLVIGPLLGVVAVLAWLRRFLKRGGG